MAKNIDKVKSGLKLRTAAKDGALSLKLGVRKVQLPFETRLIQSDEYIFIHVPPSAEIFKIDGKRLVMVTTDEEAEKAVNSFKKSRKRTRRPSAKSVDLPTELESALSKLPAGYKLGYDADGNPRVVKTRTRKSSK